MAADTGTRSATEALNAALYALRWIGEATARLEGAMTAGEADTVTQLEFAVAAVKGGNNRLRKVMPRIRAAQFDAIGIQVETTQVHSPEDAKVQSD